MTTTPTPIPFTAAIFDLDGTLLDSTWVWREVDHALFRDLGIPEPEDYARVIQGMSFRETAEYAARRFNLPQSIDEIIESWTRVTADTYAHRVPMKPGALDYLRALKRAGVKLAVATANREVLFGPTLRRWGAWDLFDAICTSADVGDVGKGDGSLFRLAAARLGVDPADCAVFEDTLEGIRGARRAGMRAYALRDIGYGSFPEAIDALADAVIDDFTQLALLHALPAPRRCVIFTARCDGDPARAYAPRPDDFVLCADGGWQLAKQAGVAPDLVIGDFDSSDAPADAPVERQPREKDDTDTMLCLKRGIALGFDDFLIVGGFGGRVDHTLSNLQTLHYAAIHRVRAAMCDGLSWATVLFEDTLRVPANLLDAPTSNPLDASASPLPPSPREVARVAGRRESSPLSPALPASSTGFPSVSPLPPSLREVARNAGRRESFPADSPNRPLLPPKLSVFALDGECRGVTIRGTKYLAEDRTLSNAFPLGVSNEFASPEAEITVLSGALLITLCRD